MKNTGINAVITFLGAFGSALLIGALGLIVVSVIAAALIGVAALIVSFVLNLLISVATAKPKQSFVDMPVDDGDH